MYLALYQYMEYKLQATWLKEKREQRLELYLENMYVKIVKA